MLLVWQCKLMAKQTKIGTALQALLFLWLRMDFMLYVFTSAKEVMFLPEFVCLCVSKITQKVIEGFF